VDHEPLPRIRSRAERSVYVAEDQVEGREHVIRGCRGICRHSSDLGQLAHVAMLAGVLCLSNLESMVVLGSDVLGGAFTGVSEAKVQHDAVIHDGRRAGIEVNRNHWPWGAADEKSARPAFNSCGLKVGGIEAASGWCAEHFGVHREFLQKPEVLDETVPARLRPMWQNEQKSGIMR